MSDYIKREDAIRIARLQGKNAQFDGMTQDVAPVRHGRWEDEFKEDAPMFVKHRYVCTACSNWQTYGKTAYCPNCGATMDR